MNYKTSKNKKAQGSVFGMSFGTIFSIILIIFIVVVGFIGIRKFLEIKNCGQIGNFVSDLEEDVKSVRNSPGATRSISNTVLPNGIKYVCFANFSKSINGNEIEKEIGEKNKYSRYSDANMFLYPEGKTCKMQRHEIKYIDLEYITRARNPRCYAVEKGKIDLTLEYGMGMNLVRIR